MIQAITDYPFSALGDEKGDTVIRRCTILTYDGDKYCDILVYHVDEYSGLMQGYLTSIKAGYIYTMNSSSDNLQCIAHDTLLQAVPQKIH